MSDNQDKPEQPQQAPLFTEEQMTDIAAIGSLAGITFTEYVDASLSIGLPNVIIPSDYAAIMAKAFNILMALINRPVVARLGDIKELDKIIQSWEDKPISESEDLLMEYLKIVVADISGKSGAELEADLEAHRKLRDARDAEMMAALGKFLSDVEEEAFVAGYRPVDKSQLN